MVPPTVTQILVTFRMESMTVMINTEYFQYISNKMQHYTVYLYLENCSTCFGWYHYPSSGAHTTVSTASGICHTATAIRRYRGRVGIDAVATVVCAPDDGWKYHP